MYFSFKVFDESLYPQYHITRTTSVKFPVLRIVNKKSIIKKHQ